MGIAKIPPTEALHDHRHQQAEIYLILEGTGLVWIDGKARPVEAESAVFIPGTSCTPARTRGHRIYGSLTFFPRTSSRRLSTSSMSSPESHP